MTVNFKLNDIVHWTSQAGGIAKKKTGKIIEVVPAGKEPMTVLRDPGGTRNHVSYVVHVEGAPRSSEANYWPRVSGLRVVHFDTTSEHGTAKKLMPKAKVERRLTTCPTCHGSGMVSSVRVPGTK